MQGKAEDTAILSYVKEEDTAILSYVKDDNSAICSAEHRTCSDICFVCYSIKKRRYIKNVSPLFLGELFCC